MKTIFLTPDELAMAEQEGKERWARGEPMPHPMLRLPEGTLMLMRVENVMSGPIRRAWREAIAAGRHPPDESCAHCGEPLSSECPAVLIFRRSDAPDRCECSPLCHTCAAVPDEELLAAAARRRNKSEEERAVTSKPAPPAAVIDEINEQFAHASNHALGMLKTEGELAPLYFIWRRDGYLLACHDNTLARLYWIAGESRMMAHFAEFVRGPERLAALGGRYDQVLGEIVVQSLDGVQFINSWSREIQRGADGTITSFGEPERGEQLLTEALHAFLHDTPSRAERRAAKRQLKRHLRKLDPPMTVVDVSTTRTPH